MDSTCDEVDGLIDKNFGDTYTLAKKGIDDFTKGFKFKINYLGLSEIVSCLKLSIRCIKYHESFHER